MTPSTQPEIERKYEVPAGAEPRWSDLPRLSIEAEPQSRSLEATYYDTPDGRLARFGLALRRRRGGPDEGWHLKFRADGTKHEVHVPLLKTADRLPAQMRQLVSGLTRAERLEPLAVLRNERQVLDVRDPDHGRVAEICLDDVRGTASASGITRAWKECEVELVNGTDADGRGVFDEIEAVLLAAGLTPSASSAKIARTLGAEDRAEAVTLIGPDGQEISSEQDDAGQVPATAQKASKKGEKAGKGEDAADRSGKSGKKSKSKGKKTGKDEGGKKGPAESRGGGEDTSDDDGSAAGCAAPERQPRAEETLEQVVASAVRSSVEQVLWADFLARIGAEGSVHGLRRAARSCEAMLIGLGPDLRDPAAAEQACELVREMSQELSAVRDAEVIEELLPLRAQEAGAAVSRSALAHLDSMAHEHREAQVSAAGRRLVSTEHQQTLAELTRLLGELRLSKRAAELTPKKLGARMTERWLETVLQLGPVPVELVQEEAVLEHVHAVRRALRLLSFGAELFETTALRARKSQAFVFQGAEGYLETCGELMDSRVMDLWYASAARSLVRTGGDRYGVGILHGRERAVLEASCEDSVLILEELFDRLDPQD